VNDDTVDLPRPQPGPAPAPGPFSQAADVPPQYIAYATPVLLGYRTGGLIVFGVISIILGALAGCGALATPFALMTAKMQPAGMPRVDGRSLFVGFVMYVAASAAFVTLGIGSIRKRRWVRPVILSISLPALVMGVFGYAVLLYILPDMFRPIPGQPAIPKGMLQSIKVVTAALSFIMYVVLPGAYYFFYRQATIRATLDALDPHPAWTDRAPLPVLGLAIWLALGCFFAAGSLIFPIVPAFGRYVTGVPAMLLVGVAMLLLLLAAVLTYRSSVAGWWLALILLVVVTATYTHTSYLRGLGEYYRVAGFDEQQQQMLSQMRATGPRRWESLASLVPAAVALGYLLWVHRHFTRRPTPAAAQVHAGPAA
jgi:hypothetical protein